MGFGRSEFDTVLFAEYDEHAQKVLKRKYSDVPLVGDVCLIESLPRCDVVTAGFPCQDLSMAGGKKGINGNKSNVVSHLFRLLESAGAMRPNYVVIENVAYMLKLDKGSAMAMLVNSLERLGYRWAYRTVDARSFGVPQRRHRVIMVASLCEAPERILFADEYGECPRDDALSPLARESVYGFYWTEGRRGIGWARDSVPPIKGGSTIGIPSPPALWDPETDFIGTIDIRDAERLQGFPSNWTAAADANSRRKNTARWRLVGNAVCVPKIRWVASRLLKPADVVIEREQLASFNKWPWAAHGAEGKVTEVKASLWPKRHKFIPIQSFLKHPLKPLSPRATAGYLSRLKLSTCNVPGEFLSGVSTHLAAVNEV